jgi:hypothetical protein
MDGDRKILSELKGLKSWDYRFIMPPELYFIYGIQLVVTAGSQVKNLKELTGRFFKIPVKG